MSKKRKINTIEIGIMPFFSNYAFVYTDKLNSAQEFAKPVQRFIVGTSGHELGHGVFGFYHLFKEPNNPTLPHRVIETQKNLNQTQNNFMDYNIVRKSWFWYQVMKTNKFRNLKK